jgi:hypothetical protein
MQWGDESGKVELAAGDAELTGCFSPDSRTQCPRTIVRAMRLDVPFQHSCMPFDVKALSREDFWRELCPDAPLTAQPFDTDTTPYHVDAESVQSAHASLFTEGYMGLPPLLPPSESVQIAEIVSTVTAAGLPAPFALIYDPIWRALQRIAPVMSYFLGSEVTFVADDCWTWQVDGVHESKGWDWHRDKWQAPGCFDERGRPAIVTLWIPFTNSTLENGCIEVLPESCDPSIPNDLVQATVPPGRASFVRPLPARAGAPLVWNTRVLHRGRSYEPSAREPRISMGIYVQNSACQVFKGCEFRIGDPIPLAERLGMIAGQVLRYGHLYRIAQELLDACKLWNQLRAIVIQRRSLLAG